MCGIIGEFDFGTTNQIDTAGLKEGMQRMRNRGPDDSGLHQENGLILGHQRLAVIDIQGGHQPSIDKKSRTVLVFNGEIYNFRSVRKQLDAEGIQFATQSDTEVLHQALIQWGPKALNRIEGMFAFALYSPRESSLWLARDPLGIKPLYYAIKNQHLYFASSCSALLAFDAITPAADPIGLSHYLSTIRTSQHNHTLFADIHSLLPGQHLKISRQRPHAEPQTYWQLPITSSNNSLSLSLQEACLEIRSRIHDTISEQLISDVPLGGFLSGGLDSTILAIEASRQTRGHYHAYSVGYPRNGFNEWEHVQTAAAHLNMQCRCIELDEKDYPTTWQHLISQKGLPISTPNEIGIYHLANALKQDYTVALSGEGADEIFGGYTIPQFSAFDFDRAPRRSTPQHPLAPALQRLYGCDYIPSRLEHYFMLNSWIPFARKTQMLQPDFWHQTLRQDQALLNHYASIFDRLTECSTFNAYMHIHAGINLEGLLSRVDTSTMAASVEARVPFTDRRIAEFCFQCPDSFKIDFRSPAARQSADTMNITEIIHHNLIDSKRLLRQAYANDTPPSILQRPKVSFAVPFLQSMPEWINQLSPDLLKQSQLIRQIIQPDFRDNLLSQVNTPEAAMTLWPLVNIALWEQQYHVTLSG